MTQKISSEEKLLRLIKGENQKSPGVPKAVPHHQTSLKVVQHEGHPLSFVAGKLTPFISFTFLSKILLACFLIATVHLVFSYVYPEGSLKFFKPVSTGLQKALPKKESSLQEPRSLDAYLSVIGTRNIFSPLVSEEIEEPTPAAVAGMDSVKDLNLMAILSGKDPQAVLEDKNTQKVYYVSKGQLIGEIQVVDIQEGKVILNYKNINYELYL